MPQVAKPIAASGVAFPRPRTVASRWSPFVAYLSSLRWQNKAALAIHRPAPTAFEPSAKVREGGLEQAAAGRRDPKAVRQPPAGRRQASPETPEDAYYAIARLCDQWQRLMAALDRPPTADPEGVRVVNPIMPPTLRKLLTRAATVMGELGKAVSQNLDGESGEDQQ